VCAYLNAYRENTTSRSKYSRAFFRYLLSVCWLNIYRRISSWRGLGLIYKLSPGQSKFKSERIAWENVQLYDVRNEKYLVRFLLKYPNIIEGLGYASGPGCFDALISAIKRGAPQLYTKETADDFHHLVYAVFVTFGRALCQFGQLQKGKAPRTALEAPFGALRAQAELFLLILTSSAFKQHLEILWSISGPENQEEIPKFSEREEYLTFGEHMQIWDFELVAEGAHEDTGSDSEVRSEFG